MSEIEIDNLVINLKGFSENNVNFISNNLSDAIISSVNSINSRKFAVNSIDFDTVSLPVLRVQQFQPIFDTTQLLAEKIVKLIFESKYQSNQSLEELK